MDAWFVVSWYGRQDPDPGTPGVVRGVHDRSTAERQATLFQASLDEKYGNLAVWCRAFDADTARKMFSLSV